jgi:GTP-binding protein
MNLNNVNIAITAVNPKNFPADGRPEIAFVGRSNVGKSSLINALLNRKSLARTSSKPGKTRVINFYDIDKEIYFVDLPGYGYAKVSKGEKESWGEMIEQYISSRSELKMIIHLMDIRHSPTELDRVMINWIIKTRLNYIVAATKSDKLKASEIEKNLEEIRKKLSLPKDKIMAFSSEKKTGRDELWKSIADVTGVEAPKF